MAQIVIIRLTGFDAASLSFNFRQSFPLSHNSYEIPTLRSAILQEKAHLRAAYYWLNLYAPSTNASCLERTRGCLEAAHHLRQIQAWKLISQILWLQLEGEGSGFLYQQLGDSGLFKEQIDLYLPLVGKTDEFLDLLCWQGLGEAYTHLGRYQQAIEAFKSLLQLARQKSHLLVEARALEGLGRCYGNWGNYQTARAYCQESWYCLDQFKDEGDRNSDIKQQKGQTLATLSYVAIHLRQYRRAIACGEQALAIAREIDDLETQWYALGRLAISYAQLGQGQKAFRSLEQQYRQRHQNQDLRQVSALLINFGLICCYQRKFQLASQCVQESWEIHQQMGDANGQCSGGDKRP